MAMYKEADITADLIKTKFPDVAAQLAGDGPEITLEVIKSDYPDIAASLIEEGKKSVDTEALIEAEIAAEHARIKKIEAIKAPGFEALIAEAKFDRSVTVEALKIKLFDAQQEKAAKRREDVVADGEEVAALVRQIDNDVDDAQTDDEKEAKLAESIAEKINV